MRPRQDDVECHIMYCGEPTIDCCIASIDDQTLRPSRIIVIEDVTPINESINERHRNMQKTFSVKVDADCILYPRCFELLYKAMVKKGPEYYATSCLTLDPFVGVEGGIHLERTACLRNLEVPDIIGCDRFIQDEMEKQGYKFFEIPKKVLAEHWSDWSWQQVFKKSMRIGQKHLYFKVKRHNWIRNFAKRWLEGNSTAFIAVLGYCYGLLNPDGTEKGANFAENELDIIGGMIKSNIIPKPDKFYSLRKG